MSKDYDLLLFSRAIDILVTASQLKIDPFNKEYGLSSIGVTDFGNVDTFEKLAGALNHKGYRTKTGKYIRGNHLKIIKHRIIQKYGDEFISNLVSWNLVGREYFVWKFKLKSCNPIQVLEP